MSTNPNLHTQIKHPTTDTQSWEQNKLTVCAGTPATSPHCGAPSTLCFARPHWIVQTTHTSQTQSSSLITFAAQGLLVLSRLAQCTAVTLQHFQGHTTDPGALSCTPKLHCHNRSGSKQQARCKISMWQFGVCALKMSF